MPTSTLRHSAAGLLRPTLYPTARTPFLHLGTEVGYASVSHTPGGSNVKASYTEVFTAIAGDCDALLFDVYGAATAATASPVMFDIATGAAASEVDIVPNFAAGYSYNSTASGTPHKTYLFPVRIASGTRVAVRAQGAEAAPKANTVSITAIQMPFGKSPPALVNMGADTSTSRGVTVNAADTWTQITASTTLPLQGVVFTWGHATDTSLTAGTDTISLGVGGAGSEVEIMRSRISLSSGEYSGNHSIFHMFGPAIIPAGTRIAAKGSNAATNNLDVVVMGVPF